MRFFSVVLRMLVTASVVLAGRRLRWGRRSSGLVDAVAAACGGLGGRGGLGAGPRPGRPSRRCCAGGPGRWRSAPGSTSLADDGAGPDVGAVADGDRRDEHGVASRRSCAGRRGVVLGDAVVVGEDRARADVGALADRGVAGIGQVRHLGAVADVGVLGLDEAADLALGAELGARAAGRRTGPTVAPAPMTASRASVRTTSAPSPTSVSVRVVSGPMTALGADASSRRAAGCPGRTVASRPMRHVDVDPRRGGVDDRDAVAHPAARRSGG